MRRLLLILIPAAILVGPLASTASTMRDVHLIPPLVIERCEEDMPCWDCTTMGNRICGPIPQ